MSRNILLYDLAPGTKYNIQVRPTNTSGDWGPIYDFTTESPTEPLGKFKPIPAKNSWAITDTTVTEYYLSAIPLASELGSSVNLSINEIELIEDSDYTVDYTTAKVTLLDGLSSGDDLTVDYWTTRDLIAATPAAPRPLLVIRGASPWSGEVGATWKYMAYTGPDTDGSWPRFIGFGLDDPPANFLALPGYDDSAWAEGHTTFHNRNSWVPPGPDPYEGCTDFGGVIHDGNDKIWIRKKGVTTGGDLAMKINYDDVASLFIDGHLLQFFGVGPHPADYPMLVTGSLGGDPSSDTYQLSTPVEPGEHTFAMYVAGDGAYGQAGWEIIEQPY